MKSAIIKLFDYHDVPVEWKADISCPEEEIQKAFHAAARKYKTTMEPEVIAKGDVVLLTLESEMERFCKKMIPVTVGAYLYDEELEDGLIGHHPGENFTLNIQEKPVKVTVRKCTRTVFPKPTDQMIADYAQEHAEYEGIKDAEAFRNAIIANYEEEARNDALYGRVNDVMTYVLGHTDFNFDEEELKAYAERLKEEERQMLLNDENKDLDSLSEEEMIRFLGVSNQVEMEKQVQEAAEWGIASALVSAYYQNIDPKKTDIDDERLYDFSFLEDYISKRLVYEGGTK